MGGQESKEISSTDLFPSKSDLQQRIVQNFVLIWLDESINRTNSECRRTFGQFQRFVNDVRIFTNPDQCFDFIETIENEKAFVITSGSLGEKFIPQIDSLSQITAIYIFSMNKSHYKSLIKTYPKVKSIHTTIKSICQELEHAVKQCNQDSIAMNFLSINKRISTQNLDQLESSFMYTQLFKEILLEMTYDQQSIRNLAHYCRQFYGKNSNELRIIDEFECQYRSKSSIWWYTRECFTYHMLNRALRMLEGETIINMGFFIRDLHKQIRRLYEKQIKTYHGKSFIVYRGQGLSENDFERLSNSKDGLISFNNFLSTSKKQRISYGFARYASARVKTIGVLFRMTIDPSISSTPFASIRQISYCRHEDEILFSMHTIFRIGQITSISKKTSLYRVELQLTADNDQQLCTLTERIRKEVAGETGWKRLGQLLIKLSQFDKAEQLYMTLLQQTNDPREQAAYYHQLAYIKRDQGHYRKAIEFHEKGQKIWENYPPAQSDLATAYNNIGMVYSNTGDYSQALAFHEQALEIRKKQVPIDELHLATSYSNLAGVYFQMEDYSKALIFYKQDLEITERILPSNHPSLATCYNNIASVYHKLDQYDQALVFYHKTFDIFEKTLPSNHPSLAITYNNIASIYDSIGEYSQALSFYKQTLEIFEQTLASNHPSLATLYNNIASVYDSLHDYSQALRFYQRALSIFRRSLPSTHPHIPLVQRNISILEKKFLLC